MVLLLLAALAIVYSVSMHERSNESYRQWDAEQHKIFSAKRDAWLAGNRCKHPPVPPPTLMVR